MAVTAVHISKFVGTECKKRLDEKRYSAMVGNRCVLHLLGIIFTLLVILIKGALCFVCVQLDQQKVVQFR
jgi:hypothetical protein